MRAVHAARTPVVSAIGHESDVPLLDHVADLAASTPTDAGKRIVPDLAEELRQVGEQRDRARDAMYRRIERETELMAGLPERMRGAVRARITREADEVGSLRDRARRRVALDIERARAEIAHLAAQVRTLSPQSTLDRGYAVVRRADGSVIRDAAEAAGMLRVRVARGEFEAAVVGDR